MAILSTSESRRPLVAASALSEFSRRGYHGTTVADIARAAKISPAYVFKLFPSKERLFVAAFELCTERILETLAVGADASKDSNPDAVLDSMGDAYAHLISDRALLMLQVHAQSVADVPEIGQAVRAGLAAITRFAKTRTGASDDAVQKFVAYGQLCHLLVTAGIVDAPDDWARILSNGIQHPA